MPRIPHISRRPLLTIVILVVLQVCACSAMAHRVKVLSGEWRFIGEPQNSGASIKLDDRQWRGVRVPHDWAIQGPFDPNGPGNTGKLPWRGEGWYRKDVSLAAEEEGKRIYLLFDGVMAEPKVYVNGHFAGEWDYGYNSFWIDATKFVKFGQANVIAVHANTTRHESRWYPGGGLYRKVTLHVCEPVHFEHWGTQIITRVTKSKSASVTVRTHVENHLTTPQKVHLSVELFAPQDDSEQGDGSLVGTGASIETIPARGNVVVEKQFSLKNAQEWDVKRPALYTARLRVSRGEEILDDISETFGVRKIEFTAKYGFYLNGRRLPIRGVNLHHDLGPLGAAFHPRAMERQLEIMQEMGVNAIRTSHNPAAPELLDMCDRMGLLVFNELYDRWDATADLHDPSQRDRALRQNARNFVRRDRNHPCVMAWSIGNDILDGQSFANGEDQKNIEMVVGFFKRHDPTRPVTMGCSLLKALDFSTLDALDIQSWNYGRKYAQAKKRYPSKPTILSESASAFSTRGFYRLPHPDNKTRFDEKARQVDSYDWNATSWGDIADKEMARMEIDRFCSGEFAWTGFDYLGGPTPFNDQWARKEDEGRTLLAARSSYSGVVDLVGIPKDRYYLYRSHWASKKTTIHLLPHWNWDGYEGKPVPVYLYTNGDEAELFINGKSLGRRKKITNPPGEKTNYYKVLDRYRMRWNEVIYQPGELRAVAYRKGKEIGSASVRTAGEPCCLRLTPDRRTISAKGDDLCYVLVEAVDPDGTLAPLADHQVQFHIDGSAEILAIGNGNPLGMESFSTPRRQLFFGKAMVILRSIPGEPGEAILSATAGETIRGRTKIRTK